MSSMIKNIITDLDIKNVYLNSGINWEIFRDKTFYITGSTGVIGSFIIRCLLNANKQSNLNLKVIAAVRNIATAITFFNQKEVQTEALELYKSDVTNELDYSGKVDYIIHAASNTSSASFIEKPVETFNVAVKGTENILNFAKEKSVESIVYLSSMEVYGNIDNPKPLKESDFGDLDANEARSSYPLGKRAAENLCYSYAEEYEIPVKVVRLAQVIGSNVAYNDTRVYAQFARSIVEKRDIVLNTTAQTTRSYCYITDVVTGILTVLTKGQNGECYNIANEESSFKICDIAKSLCSQYTSSNLIFDIKESAQYYKETHWVLDNTKLKNLGWEAKITLKEAYNKLINSFCYQKKFYIIGVSYDIEGLCAIMTSVTAHCLYARSQGYIPIVDMKHYQNQYFKDDRAYKDNSWEYYFKQPDGYSLKDIDINSEIILSKNKFAPPNTELITCVDLPEFGNVSSNVHKQKMKQDWKNVIEFNDETKEYFNNIYSKYIDEKDIVLGVLARGTDYLYKKPKNENRQPEPSQIIKKVKEVLNKYPEINKIYLSTEDAGIYELFKKTFGDMIIDNHQYRYSYDKNKKDFLANIKIDRPNHNYELGREYLSSIYILSKCKYFIGGRVAGTKYVWIWSEDKIYNYIFSLGKYGRYSNKILKKIFSFQNTTNKKHKVLTICGVKFKFKRKNKKN